LADLPILELVENRRRAVAMLPSGAPALNRDEALELLEEFKAALLELPRLRALVGGGASARISQAPDRVIETSPCRRDHYL
jgi:hypothetical protein